ncbi:hypothetical protein [Microbacterium sp.]|uniref:hypothetical protein n=1 Tax=Microbacterium sp. TaxID=51671 RepID=UPI002635C7F7|nr:hypothetical protein [Microbacterium sp.]
MASTSNAVAADRRQDADRASVPRVIVRPAAAALVVMIVAAATVAYGVHVAAGRLGAVDGDDHAVLFIAVFAVGVVVLMLCHELGHVVAYYALGLGWAQLKLGLTFSVRPRDTPRTWQQAIIAPAGPILHLIVSAGLVAATASQPWTVLWLVGAVGALEAGGNLLLPIPSRSDAAKMYRAVWGILRGRGANTWQ